MFETARHDLSAVEEPSSDIVFFFDQFELDCRAFELRHSGVALRISAIVLRLLEMLVRHRGELVTKDRLISEVWNGRIVSENSLMVAVTRLRKVFAEHGLPRTSLVTIYRYGYRFTLQVSSASASFHAAKVATLGSVPLVGRTHTLLQLSAALSEAWKASGQLVALRGEAGIGKTRIAELFAKQAADAGCMVAWAQCRETAVMPLGPIIQLMHSMSAFPGSDELLRLLSDGARRSEALADARHQLFETISQAWVAAAKTAPLVLFLDDLQRADQASLALLRHFIVNISRTRILIVATLRAGLDSPTSSLIVHRNCVRIAVEPLRPVDVADYLAEQLGAVDRALCQRVYELSDGNPSCMLKLVQPLRDRGTNAAALARAVHSERLSALSPDAHELLSYAAVIGRAFGLPLLAAAMQRTAAEVMITLETECATEVERAGMQFRFRRGLVHAARYEALSPAERRIRHARIAEALRQRRWLADVCCAERSNARGAGAHSP
jgi:predicted ATPase/DNA-binding winged helix-turn-helix (wHTH) protein